MSEAHSRVTGRANSEGLVDCAWRDRVEHQQFLAGEAARLLDFARGAVHARFGFSWLSELGVPLIERPVPLWVTARMTHVFGLAHLQSFPGAGRLTAHGVQALRTHFHDHVDGGWFLALDPHSGQPIGVRKTMYDHAFVALAASSGTRAGTPGAEALLEMVLRVIERHFWSDAEHCCIESYVSGSSMSDPYRGANANMHAVEAFLAVADVTGDVVWRDRAHSICAHIIDRAAREHGWRVPEHFDAQWSPLPEYNADRANDLFQPYGWTVGHSFEWARLLLQVEASMEDAPGWLYEAARGLFDTAVAVGWAADGKPGFVYTLDWQDCPAVSERMHWVLAEAIGAASALFTRTSEARFDQYYRAFWEHAVDRFIDLDAGSWHHEVDPDGVVSQRVWSGKPDIYHTYQATLIPRLPLAPALCMTVSGLNEPVGASHSEANPAEPMSGDQHPPTRSNSMPPVRTGRPARPEVAAFDVNDLAARARALLGTSPRIILGLVGPPGAGKSTLAAALVAALQDTGAVAIPLDGFHLSAALIRGTPLSDRRGAPDTFDVDGYRVLLERLRDQQDDTVVAPEYSREIEDPIAGSIPIPRTARIVIAEGNYLLAPEPRWRRVRGLLDAVWYVDLDEAVRRHRLVRRHIAFGKQPRTAETWADGSDEDNARYVRASRGGANLIVEST